jgi:hypothetical protein
MAQNSNQTDSQPYDPVERPKHYTSHPSGIECIQVTEHMTFCRGNAIKYIWRAGEKGDPIQDLRKAIWYLEREIERTRPEGENTLGLPLYGRETLPNETAPAQHQC